jgi:hypothetical protein
MVARLAAAAAVLLLPAHALIPAWWEAEKYKEDQGQWVTLPQELIRFNTTVRPPVPPPPAANTSIFLGISSFRDYRCGHTLFHAFSKARHPARLFVGVAQQNTASDVDCLVMYCKLMRASVPEDAGPEWDDGACPYADNVLLNRMNASEAKGPVWARHHQQLLLGDQDFCLQVDAHSDFVYEWDVHLVNEWRSAENEYAVLTTYPPDSSQLRDFELDGELDRTVPLLCGAEYTVDGPIRNSRAFMVRHLAQPKLTAFWAAGLSFSKCHAEKAVPYDKHLKVSAGVGEGSRRRESQSVECGRMRVCMGGCGSGVVRVRVCVHND